MEWERQDESIRLFRSRPRYAPIVSVFLAQCLGVSCRDFGIRPELWLGVGAAAWVIWGVVRLRSVGTTSSFSQWWLLAAVAGWMAAYATADWAWRDEDNLARQIRDGAPICVEAEVMLEPILPADDRVLALVRVCRVRDRSRWRDASGVARLRIHEAELATPLACGRRLRIVGRARLPPRSYNPGELGFAERCRNQGVDLLLDANGASIRELQTLSWRPSISAWRRQAAAAVARCVSVRNRGVALALIVGERSAMGRKERELFVALGVMHLLAISGLHVGMVIACFWYGARLGWVGRTAQLASGLILAIGFAAFTGAQPPVLRATLFLMVVILGRCRNREIDSATIICTAGAILLLVDPSHLFETGVHLSFVAVIVLSRFAGVAPRRLDPIERLISRSRPLMLRMFVAGWRRTMTLLWVSTCVYVVLTPLTVSTFHVVTPYTPLLNLVLTPLTAAALLSGVGAVLLELTTGQGEWLSWLCEWAIEAIKQVLWRVERLPGATFWTAGPPSWWAPWIYGVLAAWMLPVASIPRGNLLRAIGTAAVGLALALASRSSPETLRCTFLSVGHGACVVVQTPDGRTVLYDAGSLGRAESGAWRISQALWASGIRSVDTIVVSHADQDHFNCVADVARRIPVGCLYATEGFYSHPDTRRLQRELRSRGVRFLRAFDDAELPISAVVTMRFLHPQDSSDSSDNAQSLLLEIAYSGRTILLTGDLEREGMSALLARPPRTADIVLAPHHGSRHSDPSRFLAWAQPRWVIASTGPGRSMLPLHMAAEGADCNVLSTASQGALRVSIDGERCRVEHWSGRAWTAIER